MRFDHEFTVEAPHDDVWSFLMDVPRMAECVPGATDVVALEENTYDATVAAKIGPISAKFICRISVQNVDNAAKTGSVELTGKDTKLGGGVKANMQMSLAGDPAGPTIVRIGSDVDVMGKIGQYGHGMISKRADAMLVEFANCAREKVAASAS